MYEKGAEDAVCTGEITRWVDALAHVDAVVGNSERIDQIRALEELKAAAAAAQAQVSMDLLNATREERAAAGVPAEERSKGVAEQVALARREAPARGGRFLGLAMALAEMPYTATSLRQGRINEWRATLLVRESACLSREDRGRFDAELNFEALAQAGDRKLVAEAKQIAYRIDAEAVVRRSSRAHHERRVTLRPAPDTMTYLTALLPVAQGVAVHAALSRCADALRAQGDSRSRGQIMADALVERITGQARADDLTYQVHLVITDQSLLAGDNEPAHIPGYGVVPAEWARGQLRKTDERRTWIRRLYTAPESGQLVAMDSRARRAPKGLAGFIDARDRTCRTPWCDAPVRHRDHIRPVESGGPTTAQNLQGLCERCNYTKQVPGWQARTLRGEGDHRTEVTTPTGHRYHSRAPAQPGTRGRSGPDLQRHSILERSLSVVLPRAG
ncbi:MAG TPA: DUF222 domain-containing protein [Beutenbergiaceae bacterium]|nr:DUF222 domain-containing protein [Beutenbergiaceae bacterium]